MPAKKKEAEKTVKTPAPKPVAAKATPKVAAPKAPAAKVVAPKAPVAKAVAHSTLILKKPAPAVTSFANSVCSATAKTSAEERYQMIQQAAYFIAERHGFQGDSTAHWAEAERQITEQLGKG